MSLKSKNNFLGKIIIFIWIVLFAFSLLGQMVEASSVEPYDKEEDPHFELRATKINDDENIDGKQLIMELWGYNIEFERI